MGWIITAAILFALAFLPLGASIAYDIDGPLASLTVGRVSFPVYPPSKKTEKKERPLKEPSQGGSGKGEGGKISDFYPFVRLVLSFLVDFRHKLRVDYLKLKLVLAGGDPADLAINYGKSWTALGNLCPWLERCFVIKKRDVEVLCDFEGSHTTIEARLDISLTFGRLLVLACRYGFQGIKEFLNFRNKRQGGTI